MFKFIFLILLLPSLAFSSKQTVFVESSTNADYIKSFKEFVFLSDDFIFPSESNSARFLVNTQFNKSYIENVIFDRVADKKEIVRTNLFEYGKVFEVYNRNILNVLEFINPNNDLSWIDNYFYTFDNSSIFVNKVFHNNIKTLDLKSTIKQLKSFNDGKSILLSVLDNGISKIILIDTITGVKSSLAHSDNSFFVLLDYDPLLNKVLYKELIKGKSHYFEIFISQNITNQIALNKIDRDIIEVKYYKDKLIALIKTPEGTSLRLYNLKHNTVNLYQELLRNTEISDFKIINDTIVYRDFSKKLSLFNINTKTTNSDFVSNVIEFEILSENYISVKTISNKTLIINLNNHKQVLMGENTI